MDLLLSQLRSTAEYLFLLRAAQENARLPGLALPRAARLPVLAALHADLHRPILLLTDRADHAMALHDELGFWTDSPLHLFPEPTPLFYEDAAWGASTPASDWKPLPPWRVITCPSPRSPPRRR